MCRYDTQGCVDMILRGAFDSSNDSITLWR